MKKKYFNFMIVCIVIVFLATIFLNRNTITEAIPFKILVVKSGSMYPSINIGDIVIIKKQDNYKIGDIISYKEENYLITHRIVGMKNNDFITKGDFNNSIDEIEVNKKNVKGKVIFIIDKKILIITIFICISIVLLGFLKPYKED